MKSSTLRLAEWDQHMKELRANPVVDDPVESTDGLVQYLEERSLLQLDMNQATAQNGVDEEDIEEDAVYTLGVGLSSLEIEL